MMKKFLLMMIVVFFGNLERGGDTLSGLPPPTSLPLLYILCSSAYALPPATLRSCQPHFDYLLRDALLLPCAIEG